VEVENISSGGVSFVLTRRTAEGQMLTLRLDGGRGDRCPEHAITVTYCFEHPDGYHVAGATFERELSDEELRALL
jgi:hypothetical protein